jgi:hypothetical protein
VIDPQRRWRRLPGLYAGFLSQVVGSADITALVADRVVREMLTGLALGRSRARTAST